MIRIGLCVFLVLDDANAYKTPAPFKRGFFMFLKNCRGLRILLKKLTEKLQPTHLKQDLIFYTTSFQGRVGTL